MPHSIAPSAFKLVAAFLLVLALVIPAHTQDAPPPTEAEQHQAIEDNIAAQEELQSIATRIALSEERADTLKAEIEEMNGDRAQQNAALIAAAQRIKLAEIEAADAEARLAGLLRDEREIRARLDGEDVQIASLLAALQRIGKNPPPALVIDPTDAVNAARSATLLSAVLPQLRERADAISSDLSALVEVRAGVEQETAILVARLSSLQEEQLRIATLIEARRLGVTRVESDLQAEEDLAARLASEATSLNQLIDALRDRIDAVDQAVTAAENVNIDVSADALDPEEVRTALANTSRTEPAFPFSKGRGHLVSPTTGVTITPFGAEDGFGGISKGLFVVTRAEAQVVAPSDGWIIYKGPYLNYGEIIIIDPGEDHTILLAGLEKVTAELGQFILQGEPVGTMGQRTFGDTLATQSLATSAGVARPTLYIEFRNTNQPIDPAPWWDKARIAQIPG